MLSVTDDDAKHTYNGNYAGKAYAEKIRQNGWEYGHDEYAESETGNALDKTADYRNKPYDEQGDGC